MNIMRNQSTHILLCTVLAICFLYFAEVATCSLYFFMTQIIYYYIHHISHSTFSYQNLTNVNQYEWHRWLSCHLHTICCLGGSLPITA